MKKIITSLVALSMLGAASLKGEELSIAATVGWESEYVFRGVQAAKTNFESTVDATFGGAYLGLWSMMPVDNKESHNLELNFYGGYSFPVDDMFSMDVGATVYYYPNWVSDRTAFELYAGGSLDAPLTPALYVFYDFDNKVWTMEGSAGHSFVMGDGYSFDVGAHLGHSWRRNVSDYFFGGVSADIVYAFTDYASASIGGRLTFNDLSGAKSSNAWWGFSFTAGF